MQHLLGPSVLLFLLSSFSSSTPLLPSGTEWLDDGDGWTPNLQYLCGDSGLIIGGPDMTENELSKNYNLPSPACNVSISLSFFRLDRWENETATVTVNHDVYWSRTFGHDRGEHLCGQPGQVDEVVEVELKYIWTTSWELRLSIGRSSADFGDSAEGFGVQNVRFFADCTEPTTTDEPSGQPAVSGAALPVEGTSKPTQQPTAGPTSNSTNAWSITFDSFEEADTERVVLIMVGGLVLVCCAFCAFKLAEPYFTRKKLYEFEAAEREETAHPESNLELSQAPPAPIDKQSFVVSLSQAPPAPIHKRSR